MSMIKDEHLYLQEWIEWHLNLGVDNIFLVEDADSKSHIEIINKYPQVFIKNINDIITNDQRKEVQTKLCNYFVKYYKEDFDWIAHIDIDEYINIRNDKSLKENLYNYKDATSILMIWENYNANGHIYRPEGKITDNYTTVCGSMGTDRKIWICKIFGNLNKNPEWINCHYSTDFKKQNDIYIKHYITKSFEDYCFRIYERGDMYRRVYRNLDMFFQVNPDIDQDACKQFVLTKYGNIKELAVPLPTFNVDYNKNTTLYTQNVETCNQIVEVTIHTNGLVQIVNNVNLVGGYNIIDNKLILFLHKNKAGKVEININNGEEKIIINKIINELM